jgi:WD40 repeat protein
MKPRNILFALALGLLCFLACSPSRPFPATPTQTAELTETFVHPSPAAQPSPTPKPTKAVTPTSPSLPTETPTPPFPKSTQLISPENVSELILLTTWKKDAPITGATFSPDNAWLALDTDGDGIVLWQRFEDTIVEYALPGSEQSDWPVFSPKGDLLAARSLDDRVNIWDIAKRTLAQSIEMKTLLPDESDSSVKEILFSPDGRWLAALGETEIWLLRVSDGTLQQTFYVARDLATINYQGIINRCFAFSPDSRWLAVGDEVGTVSIWQVSDGKLGKAMYPGWSPAPTDGLAFFPNGDKLIVAGSGMSFLDVPSLEPVSISPDRDYYDPDQSLYVQVAFSPSGQLWVVSSLNDKILFWRAADGKHLHTIQFSKFLDGFSLSPDGTLLAVAAQGRLEIWGIPAP